MKRDIITDEKIDEAVETFKSELKKRLNQKELKNYLNVHILFLEV